MQRIEDFDIIKSIRSTYIKAFLGVFIIWIGQTVATRNEANSLSIFGLRLTMVSRDLLDVYQL